jgi:hypothetical protein
LPALAASQPAPKTRSGGEKSGSPTLKLIESGISSAKAKNRRIPDGFMDLKRSAGAKSETKPFPSQESAHFSIKWLRSQNHHGSASKPAVLKATAYTKPYPFRITGS